MRRLQGHCGMVRPLGEEGETKRPSQVPTPEEVTQACLINCQGLVCSEDPLQHYSDKRSKHATKPWSPLPLEVCVRTAGDGNVLKALSPSTTGKRAPWGGGAATGRCFLQVPALGSPSSLVDLPLSPWTLDQDEAETEERCPRQPGWPLRIPVCFPQELFSAASLEDHFYILRWEEVKSSLGKGSPGLVAPISTGATKLPVPRWPLAPSLR